jgi:hypothetical protein
VIAKTTIETASSDSSANAMRWPSKTAMTGS